VNSVERTYRKNNDEKEINISNIMELKVKILRYKTDRCVFGRPDFISLIPDERMPLFVFHVGREGDVEEETSPRAALFAIPRFTPPIFFGFVYCGEFGIGLDVFIFLRLGGWSLLSR